MKIDGLAYNAVERLAVVNLRIEASTVPANHRFHMEPAPIERFVYITNGGGTFSVGEERVITPEMLGAYGDGEHADHIALERAFNHPAANVIELESSVYLQKDKIVIRSGERKIDGKGAQIRNKYVDK